MKKVLKSVLYVVVLLVAFMAIQGIFTALASVVAVLYMVSKGGVTMDVLKEMLQEGELNSLSSIDNGIYIWAVSVALFLSTLATLALIHFIKGYRLKPELLRSISFKPLAYSTLLVFTSMFALNILVQWFGVKDHLADVFSGLTHNVVGVLSIAIFGPLLEEVLFRGAVQGYLMRRYKPWVAIVCAALAFGLIHVNPAQVVYATLLGLVFGWIYYRTGSLLSVIVGHVLNNSMATIVMLFFPEEETLSAVNETMPQMFQTASEVFMFVVFAALSLLFAVKLHRALPAVPSPWRDATDAVQ